MCKFLRHSRASTGTGRSVTLLEIEVPPICDSVLPALRTRVEALTETAIEGRRR